jgi:hypothetical protein
MNTTLCKRHHDALFGLNELPRKSKLTIKQQEETRPVAYIMIIKAEARTTKKKRKSQRPKEKENITWQKTGAILEWQNP